MPKGDVWYELPGGPAMAGKMPPPPCASRAFPILGPTGGSVHSSHSTAFLWEEASFPQERPLELGLGSQLCFS